MTTQHRHKRKDGLRRQAQIMSIAMNLFAEKGYHATSVDDIIRGADIVKGTFYLHFKSKQDLLNSIVDSYLNLLYESLKVLDISSPRPLEEIRDLYIAVGSQLMSDTELKTFIKLMLREVMGHDTGFLNKINSFFMGMAQLFSQYITKAQEEGRIIKTIDPTVTSYSIIGSVKEVLFHWVVMDEKLDINKSINTLIDIYFTGLIEPSSKEVR